MKHTDIARQYGVDQFKLKVYIQNHATFPVKENLWGDVIIPDDVDIEKFVQPLLQQEAEKKLKLQQQRQAEHERQEIIRQEQEESARKQREEQNHLRIERLKAKNIDGYYEYKVISLSDIGGLFSSNSGRVDTAVMAQKLNELGIDGWRLVTAYSNELGKNALSGGSGGVLLGVNSTVDENILIFERFVKI